MVRWPLPLLAVVVVSCAAQQSAPQPQRSSPTTGTGTGTSTSAPASGGSLARPSASAATSTKPHALIPIYARLDLNLANYPDRARLVRAGRFSVDFPPSDKEKEAASADDATKPVDWEPPVIEIATGTRPFRMLCRDTDAQLAAYAEPSAFSTVAREPLVLGASASPPQSFGDKDPGVRIARGTRLTVLGSASDVDHVRFEGIALKGEGFARRAQTGTTFKVGDDAASRGATRERFDAVLGRDTATMWPDAKASGLPLATLSAYPENEGAHRFQRLGPKKNGFSLMRLLHPEATVVGWIEDAALKNESGESSWEKEQRPGLGRLRANRMIAVKRGDLLLGDRGDVVGVIASDHEAACVGRCDSDTPRIAVRACGGVARALVERH